MSSSLAITGSTSSPSIISSSSKPSSSSPNYLSELSSMIYVFTLSHPSSSLLYTIQDLLRSHLSSLLLQAKLHSSSHHSHSLPTSTSSKSTPGISTTGTVITVEDMLFVIRGERGMIERLKGYLGWKDVRKRTKENGTAAAGGGMLDDEEGMTVDGIEEPGSKPLSKAGTLHLPWELQDPFQEYLLSSGSSGSSGSSTSTPISREGDEGGAEVRDGEYEKALRENQQILREADELTSKMSKEEYELYSQARQASFVYRKGKKFRDFLLFSDLASSLSEEVLDILGFLAYEFIRHLCRIGLTESISRKKRVRVEQVEKKRKLDEGEALGEGTMGGMDPRDPNYPSVLLRPPPPPPVGFKQEIFGLFSKPLEEKEEHEPLPQDQEEGGQDINTTTVAKGKARIKDGKAGGAGGGGGGIEVRDVLDGFWKDTSVLGKKRRKEGMGKGLRGFRGGAGAMKGLRRSF